MDKMDKEELRIRAQELLATIKDVLVEVKWLGWPWQPFRTPCDDELKDRRRRETISFLQVVDDEKIRLYLAKQLVLLGGYEITKGCLEISRSRFHLYDNYERITKFETLDAFATVFEEILPWWNGDQPDWNRLQDELLSSGMVTLLGLQEVTLVDIRRALPLLVTSATTSDSSPGDDEKTSAVSHRWAFDGRAWIIRFGGVDRLLPDHDGLFYYEHLLRRPNERATPSVALHQLRKGAGTQSSIAPVGVVDPQIDQESKVKIEQQIVEIRDQIEIAEDTSNDERASELHQELHVLVESLEKSKNRWGQPRSLGTTDEEKLHENVRKSLSRCRDQLVDKELAGLAHYLKRTILSQGLAWAYRPDPNHPINWEFSAT